VQTGGRHPMQHVPNQVWTSVADPSRARSTATKKLIDTANANGGINNLTVILAQYLPS